MIPEATRRPGEVVVARTDGDDLAAAWDTRLESAIASLPAWLARSITWLRVPSRRFVRMTAGVLFILGGVFSILPVLGIWMLPVGAALLADDWPALKPKLEGAARWVERTWRRLRRRGA